MKIVKIIAVILAAFIIITIVNFIPAFSLKTNNMKALSGNYVTAYYEKEEAAAKDIFELAESESERITKALKFDSAQNISMYIYDYQNVFQTKKYGFAAQFLGLDWYIGDNRGTNVMLTSPANPGKVHDYDNNKFASIHEMVHAYNSIFNRNMSLWINEGFALYLVNGNPPEDLYSAEYYPIPTISQIHTANPVEFADIGGYDFAHTYVEYLDKAFGWDKTLIFAKTMDYPKAFDKSEREIYEGWVKFLKDNY